MVCLLFDMKELFKNKAIQLRQEGLTYSEILKKVPVAKSTLSLWLRSVRLAKKQYQKLTLKKKLSALRGSAEKKRLRIEKENKIIRKSFSEIDKLSDRENFLCGVMLYWAEGSKQKETNVSVGVEFSNSDPNMLQFYLYWLHKYLSIADEDIILDIYIHENFEKEKDMFVQYWSNKLNLPVHKFNKVYFKKNIIKTKRKNIEKNYHGQIKIGVKRSTDLNRKITGWIEGFLYNAGSSNGRTSPFGGEYF
jgi:uncharacterized protein Usg